MDNAQGLGQMILAESLARRAHADQRNPKDGEDYIRHPERVVRHLESLGAGWREIATAWLHDVVEDCEGWTPGVLTDYGVDAEVVAAVAAITHPKGEPRRDYYLRVGRNRIALAVKLADIHDNTDPARRAVLDAETAARLDRKYAQAWRTLAPFAARHLAAEGTA